MGEVLEGVVKKFTRDSGFIHRGGLYGCVGKGCTKCVFVHYTGLDPDHTREVEGKFFLRAGDRVKFRLQEGFRGPGTVQACDVRVVGK